MESSGSSFIPQRPTRGKVAPKSFRKVYVLSYVSYLLFFSTLMGVAGIFLYKLSLNSSLVGLQEELAAQKNLFNQADLDRVEDLDHRIDNAKQLLNAHASVHKVMVALDRIVAEPVQFLSFQYDRVADPRKPRLTLEAAAAEFNEVIFQEQILSANAITRDFAVEEVSLSTQPVDPERLELGVTQVVNVSLVSDLSLSDVNYTGATLDLSQPTTAGNENLSGARDAGTVTGQTQDTDQSEQNTEPQI